VIQTQYDLSKSFGSARDQGPRPTCLAFAASDVHAQSVGSPITPLSPEYAFYVAAQEALPVNHHVGVGLKAMGRGLQKIGQPTDAVYPYQPGLRFNDPLPIPPAAHSSACTKVTAYRIVTGNSLFPVVDALKAGKCCVLRVGVTKPFQLVRAPNNVLIHTAGAPSFGAHALTAVGAGRDDVANELHILVRNSWGPGWGTNGYAWVPQSYLDEHLSFSAYIN
jgi:hypothetical protein